MKEAFPPGYKILLGVWFLLGAVFLISFQVASAGEYDYYVKEGSDGDGSKDNPLGSVKAALEVIGEKKNQKIFVEKGSYSAGLTLPRGTAIVGADAKTVSITGPWVLADGVQLEKLGFTGSGNILVAKNAEVTLKNLRFKDVSGPAIKTEPGNAKLTMSDSSIENARKGMYLQAGTRIALHDVVVTSSREEGVDIRENVSGTIRSSEFRNNKESGIELVLGSASLSITGNTFLQNGASGIAAQFFDGAKKLGDVRIEGNTFSKNEWGVNCKAPQGKMDSKYYFLNSIAASGNTFQNNSLGEIAPTCKIMTDEERRAFEAEEAKKKELAAKEASLLLSEAAAAERMEKAVAERKSFQEERSQEELRVVKRTIEVIAGSVDHLEADLDDLERQSVFLCQLVGPSVFERENIKRSKEELENIMRNIEEEGLALRFESSRDWLRTALLEKRATLTDIERRLSEKPCQWSLFGWVGKLTAPYRDPVSLLSEDTRSLRISVPRDTIFFMGPFGYYPKVRSKAILEGDTVLFAKAKEKLRSYESVLTLLPKPFMTDIDPLPQQKNELLFFPTRWASILAASNITHALLGREPSLIVPESLAKTKTQAEYAGIHLLGKDEHDVSQTVLVGNTVVTLVVYRVGEGTSLERARAVLQEGKKKSRPVIAILIWEDKQTEVTSEMRALVRGIIDDGADLVIGYGKDLPRSDEDINGKKVYYSLGSAWKNFEYGLLDKALGVEVRPRSDGSIEIYEQVISFSETEGFLVGQ